jgi:hypothetical protein
LQESEAGVERVVSAFVNGPGRELRRIRNFLQRQQVAETLKNRRWTQTLHALQNDDKVSEAGSKFWIFDNLEEALTANSEEQIVIAYFAVVLKGE